PEIQARDPAQHGQHATLLLHARRVADGDELPAGPERRERAAIAVLPDAVEDNVEPARQDAGVVFALVVDWRGAQLADQRSVLGARGAPDLHACDLAECDQRLTDGARGSVHEHALAALHAGRAMQHLVGRRPAQDQRGGLGRVDALGYAGQVAGPERAIAGVGADDRHIGHAVANPKAAHARADLVDLPDHVVTHHERRPAQARLGVEVAPDERVGVLDAGREHANPHLAAAGRRQGSLDDLQAVGLTEARDLNHSVALYCDSRIHGLPPFDFSADG